MSFAIVSTNGRYHGHVATVEDARASKIVKESTVPGYLRLLTDEQWNAVKHSDNREAAFATAGVEISK